MARPKKTQGTERSAKDIQKSFDQIHAAKAKMSEILVREDNESDESFNKRQSMLDFAKVQAMKETLLQNVSKTSTNRSFMKYTKSLVKQYLENPYSYRLALMNLSRYLWRVSSLYKKIVLYYATMCLYNYNVTEKVDLTKTINSKKSLKNYQNILKTLQPINFYEEFATMIALAIRDGLYAGFTVYSAEEGTFFLNLDPEYVRVMGKNQNGQWVIAFDATYFTKGNNRMFVEGIDGDTNGCWPQEFIDGFKDYDTNGNDYRWFELPSEKTMVLLANLSDEFDLCLPFFTGLFIPLLDCLDYQDIMADKNALENYFLLLSKVPLLDGTNTVDDLAISMDLVEAVQEMISEIAPSLVGVGWTPLDVELVSFGDKVNSTSDNDMVSKSIENIFSQSGTSQLVVSSSLSSNSVGLKYSILNDTATTFIWISRLESAFQYIIDSNMPNGSNYIFKFHRQTWYNKDEYIDNLRQNAALGACSGLDILTAQSMTPYEAICKLTFEDGIGIKNLMVPLMSSYNTSIRDRGYTRVGRRNVSDGDISDSGIQTRDNGSNDARDVMNE